MPSPKLRRLISVGGTVALLEVAALVALAGGDSDDAFSVAALSSPTFSVPAATATAPPTAIPTAAPTAVPTAIPTPLPRNGLPSSNPFSDFRLEIAAVEVEFVEGAPSQAPPEALSVWFLDIETSAMEGWIDSLGGLSFHAFSGDNRLVAFERREGLVSGGVPYRAGFLLADRVSERVYRWQGEAELVLAETPHTSNRLASRDGLVMFRIAADEEPDWFALVDLDSGDIESTFQAEGVWALLSNEGDAAVVFGDGRLSLADLSSGAVRTIAHQLGGGIDLEGRVSLQNSLEGEGFLLLISPNKVEHGSDSGWWHFGWKGDLLAAGFGQDGVYPSPSGELVAQAEPILRDEISGVVPWYAINVFDTKDGRLLFRVVGVLNSGASAGTNRWLADGSGIMVSSPEFVFAMAMSDGNFLPFVGLPSPASTSLFAISSSVEGGPAVVDAAGTVIAAAPAWAKARFFVSPWGTTGSEIRFIMTIGGGHGPGINLSLIRPYIELEPYSGPPVLRLRDAGLGAQLF